MHKSRNGRVIPMVLASFVLSIVLIAAPAGAQEGTTDTTAGAGEDAAVLSAGFDAYTATCSGCHQAGGVGIEGTFPPLVDNPNITDPAYIVETIRTGKQGEIEVNGVTYNGVMPAFDALPDEQVEAIVAYIEAGFQVPAGGGATGDQLPVATGTLPQLSGMAMIAAFALAGVVTLVVLGPRIVDVHDRLTMPWLDAWLRVAVIAVFFVLALAVIPSTILQTQTVARLPRAAQDVIGLGLWGGGFAVGLWALWYAHREGRI